MSWVSFGGVFAVVLTLLGLHLGFGLIVGLILASICRAVYLRLPKNWPLWTRKTATYVFLTGLVMGLLVLSSSGVRYSVKTVQSQKENVTQYLIAAGQEVSPHLPQPLRKHLPSTVERVQEMGEDIMGVFGKHALAVGGTGMHLLMQFIFAVLIAASICTRGPRPHTMGGAPLREQWLLRIHEYQKCFSTLMGAQVYVALWNAFCTALFVYLILPLMGVDLVFREALVVFTLLISLVPALGNTLANGVMAFLCLPHGLGVMASAVVFLILVHKAEYVINAKIIGQHVQATVPEMLIAILIGERLFGLPGLILGPVSYAYIKQFLIQKRLV